MDSGPGHDPVKPVGHAGTALGREVDVLDGGVDAARQGDGAVGIEIDVLEQVDLAQDHEVGGGEHVGVFDRLVVAFGDRQNDDLERLAEIEGGRANQIADVLDEHDAAGCHRQVVEGVADHMGIEVAASSGVDLDRRHAGGADALGIVGGFLVALDNTNWNRLAQRPRGRHQERRLARPRARQQIECEQAVVGEPPPVGVGVGVVLRQDTGLDFDQPRLAETGDVDAGGALAEMVAVMPMPSKLRFTLRPVADTNGDVTITFFSSSV